MPTTRLKNTLYRAALPFLAPSPRHQMSHLMRQQPLMLTDRYEQLLLRHHVMGASLLLQDKHRRVEVFTSTTKQPKHFCSSDTIFRVASITKMATSLVVLRLVDHAAFSLDDPVRALLPEGVFASLQDITVRHLLTHTSGLRDIPAVDDALQKRLPYSSVLKHPDIRQSVPGKQFSYCNFGFGLLGSVLEHVTGKCIEQLFRSELFQPLNMRATLDPTTLPSDDIMPIIRVLPYRGIETIIPPLGRIPLTDVDPLHHFGHTAGSMYTDADSLTKLLSLIAQKGSLHGQQFISERLINSMIHEHAYYGVSSPTLSYGMGLLIIRDSRLSHSRILGHQGYAYGCADGAFYEEDTGRQIIFLNGGCSEARTGRLGLCNRDIIHFALREEIPQWR